MYFLARRCAPYVCTWLLSYSKRHLRIFAVVSCAVPELSEFYSHVTSIWQTKVCDIPGAHLQGSEACNWQDIRAEPHLISAIATCAVTGLSVFYSPVASIQQCWVCAIWVAHLGSTKRFSKRHSFRLFFAVAKCAVVGLSVFYCLVLTCNLIVLLLWLLGRSVECILHLYFNLEHW